MSTVRTLSISQRLAFWLCLGFITVLSFATYVVHYDQPAAFFWDENYHVASAQKYLNGVYFMEQHPPLGKLLIAAGEAIVKANANNSQYVGTDYAVNPPANFSFAGYRLFPTLLGWLAAPLLFLCFFIISRDLPVATLGSFLYTFDNALIVHSRGAMLESPLMFFCVTTILGFLLMVHQTQSKRRFYWSAVLFGVGFGAALTTKVLALILILLAPAVLWMLWNKRVLACKGLGVALIAFLCTYVLVWDIHFALGRTIVPNNTNQGYYETSAEGRKILADGSEGSLFAFPTQLRDSLAFVTSYNRGVPQLNLCKNDENGSPFFLWPIGARSINYRWETNDSGQTHRHLYLQNNPVIWGFGLLGVIAAGSLLMSRFLVPQAAPLKNGKLIMIFFGLYASYMIAISQLDRVMYLYHYFTPLLFSFFLAILVLLEIQHIGRFKLTTDRRNILVLLLMAYMFAGWHYFHPLTYYEPMTNDEVQARAWLDIWDLHCVNCSHTNYVFTPR